MSFMGHCLSARPISQSKEAGPSKKPAVAKEEGLLRISADFRSHDLNQDGVIDRAELERLYNSETVTLLLDKLDKDRDGVISYIEFYSEISKIKDGEATLKRYVDQFPAAIHPKRPVKEMQIQGRLVPISWSTGVQDDIIDKILIWGPFTDWVQAMNRIENTDPEKPELRVENISIQNVDMFGPKLGFVKFKVAAQKWNEKMQQIAHVPGIVFMRGGAVGILCVLIDKETKKEFSLLTLQARLPAGCSDFPEIPAGMLDGEPNKQKFAGKAAQEMNEETLLEIKDTDLFDLTHMAYEDKYPGMYPSAGGCDEFLKLFLYRRYFSDKVLNLLCQAHGGGDESEIIKLKVVPLEDLWREAPDAKALSALYLYTKFKELENNGKITHPITPVDEQQEKALVALLGPKITRKLERRESLEAVKKGKSKLEDLTLHVSGESKPLISSPSSSSS